MKVSVVLPVYNCAGNLKPLFEEFVSEKPDHIDLELIWVNDASTDGSMDEIYELESDKIQDQLINLPSNLGSYEAVIEGLSSCIGEVVVVMAADGQDPPKVAFEMVSHLEKYDLVAAARDCYSGGFANRVFHRMMRKKVGAKASPDPLDMVAFRADRIPDIMDDERSRLHLFYFMDQLIANKKVIRFAKRKRAEGSSGWSLRKKVVLFVRCWLLF